MAVMPAAAWVAWDLVAATLVAEVVTAARREVVAKLDPAFVARAFDWDVEEIRRDQEAAIEYADAAGRALGALARTCCHGAATVGARWTDALHSAARLVGEREDDPDDKVARERGLVLAKLVLSRPTMPAVRLGLEASLATRVGLLASARLGVAAAWAGNAEVIRLYCDTVNAERESQRMERMLNSDHDDEDAELPSRWWMYALQLESRESALRLMTPAAARRSQVDAFRWCVQEALAIDHDPKSHRSYDTIANLRNAAVLAAEHDASAVLLREAHRALLADERERPGQDFTMRYMPNWRWSCLDVAYEHRRMECVRFLLSEPDVKILKQALELLLPRACSENDVEFVRELFARMAAVAEKVPSSDFRKALADLVPQAIRDEHIEVLLFLLSREARENPDYRKQLIGWLFLAVTTSNVRALHLLVVALAAHHELVPADATAQAAASADLGNFAVASTRELLARILNHRGCSDGLLDGSKAAIRSAFWRIPASGPLLDVTTCVAQACPTLLTTTAAGHWVYDAIMEQNLPQLEWLLVHGGADVNYCGSPDQMERWYASWRNEVRDNKSLSIQQSWPAPLGMAVIQTGPSMAAIVELLLRHGAHMHHNDDEALRLASLLAPTQVVKRLLDAGANVSALGHQALCNAATERNLPTVRLLLERGADVHASNDLLLRTAIQQRPVARSVCGELVKTALKFGANVHVDNDWPLRAAADSLDHVMARLLVEHGADVTAERNEAVRHVAKAAPTSALLVRAQTALLKLLVDCGADGKLAELLLAATKRHSPEPASKRGKKARSRARKSGKPHQTYISDAATDAWNRIHGL